MMNTHGFSLLELLILLGLWSLVFFWTLNGAGQFLGRQTLMADAQRGEANLLYLRMAAMALDQDTQAVFTPDHYLLNVEDDSSALRTLGQGALSSGIVASAGRLGFKPNGNAQYAGTIRFQSRTGQTRSLVVAPVTGRITLR